MRLRARLREHDDAWHGRAELALHAGGLYLDPVYLDPGAAPLDVVFEGRYVPARDSLELTSIDITHAGIARARGSLGVRTRTGTRGGLIGNG